MTSSGKVRIYELSKDLGLDNKDVLDAAEKLSIAAKSHSSSISDDEASRIRSLIGVNVAAPSPARPEAPAPTPPSKAILAVKKAAPAPVSAPRASAPPAAPATAAPPSAP
ncbi:translation initiation factor IF-2 N-terminal domain-containing protein, partial [Synechococcus sp. BA-120 BA3]|nr:translation initiation factor IF-2 N-terminal domain-containing protein [Synechococcus sp. BA-120 BA3]